jgi:hypothetical protein
LIQEPESLLDHIPPVENISDPPSRWKARFAFALNKWTLPQSGYSGSHIERALPVASGLLPAGTHGFVKNHDKMLERADLGADMAFPGGDRLAEKANAFFEGRVRERMAAARLEMGLATRKPARTFIEIIRGSPSKRGRRESGASRAPRPLPASAAASRSVQSPRRRRGGSLRSSAAPTAGISVPVAPLNHAG